MGYYDYQNGLIYRHLNQESGWDSHLKHCRDYIMKTVDLYKPDKVTVLGSGWLLELPIAEILEKTGKVCLIDIIHPPEVISQAGKISNVELIESDLTGGLIEEVWNKVHSYSVFSKPDSIEGIIIPEFKPESDPGMIISLNIITQLETMLVRYLKRKARIGEEEMSRFRKTVQNRHIDFISKHRSMLITDCEEIITKRSGEVNKTSTLLAAIPSFKDKEEWTWNFDSKGADYYSSRSVMRVLAVTL
ncbi:MAG: hypothetical protein A2X05_06850 [Bacteroidetes bacterium GWE2_41_25]|nr:MAG: hypothetical protein A2X03_15290 [Bacteroidetes bacterium GWA2_40_15]OFX91080.1 MAG: hypothetical protein A2X06_13645 [Bacteroidetes bacterium GWC2_40_22]OFX95811.1 MAG: hypothetical protein A2X05_06850 [Bacteroidetes bacterium GWE2_41_25]OFY60275.1 MAG: hypothetical protein A2X04_03310 [Bacteroidetes bacterium GWF2_41_9]HAM11200.1 hypothetical protein [Bacteroidales bacterium]